MTRARLMFGSLALALVGPLVLPPPAQAARDHSRGNVEAVDWSVMQIAIRTPNGRTVTYKVAPRASVKFTDCPECFPSPTYRDLAPPMYVHFEFEDLDVDEIQSFDVKEIGNDPSFRQKRLLDIGIEPVFDTPEQFGAYIRAQRASAAKSIKDAGFQPR